MHLLIDADVLVYESSFACQKTRYRVDVLDKTFDNNKAYEDELKSSPLYEDLVAQHGKRDALKVMKERCPAEKVLDMLDLPLLYKIAENKVREVVNATNAETYSLCLSSSSNFREGVATIQGYKANRVSEKPVYFEEAREWFHNHNRAVVAPDGLEADDYIGITMTRAKRLTAIATIDKDLRMIPGRHYEWNKGAKYTTTPEQSMQWFHRQMLMGDGADNIPGIDKIGEVFAKQIVDDAGTPRQVADTIEQYYAGQYGPTWKAAINEVARLLWILRSPDQQHDTKLWDTLYQGL